MIDLAVGSAASAPAANAAQGVGFLFTFLLAGGLICFGAIRVRVRGKNKTPRVLPPRTLPLPQRTPRAVRYPAPPVPQWAPAGHRPAGAAAPPDPVPGSLVAGYRLVEPIGRGGMAVVFRARDERLGRQAALKVLAPALAGDHEFRQRFVRESRAAAALDDPHIIPVFQAGQADGVLFIAMRYVRGGDVRTMLARFGPMTVTRVTSIISPVASALDTAHAAGLVHRDVKPANMLIDTRPRRPDHVYLADFGLAKSTAGSASLTGTGYFLGTLDYVSPEQIEGKSVDGRADQYALACTAFELLTGAPPFRRNDMAALVYAQLSEQPPNLVSRRSDLPPALDRAFATALAKSPYNRFPSCTDFADALRAAAGLPAYQPEASNAAEPHPPTQIAFP